MEQDLEEGSVNGSGKRVDGSGSGSGSGGETACLIFCKRGMEWEWGEGEEGREKKKKGERGVISYASLLRGSRSKIDLFLQAYFCRPIKWFAC